MKVVNITDPGHGGIDSGATGNGYKEKDLVLALVLEIDKILKEHGIVSYLTRDKDKFISLKDRTDFSNKINPNTFVSLHLNSATNIQAKGLETFNYPGSVNSTKLSKKILDELVKEKLYLANKGVKTGNFHVLRETKATAALAELVFISNAEDIKFFVDNFDKYVQVISKAIIEFNGIKYITPREEVKPPARVEYELAKDKINILLLTDHVEVGWENGFITADINKDFVPGKENIDVLLLGNKISANGFKYKDKNHLKIDGVYVPLRDTFESLGFKVEWNRNNNMLLVNRK